MNYPLQEIYNAFVYFAQHLLYVNYHAIKKKIKL